jgi:hypothetical protein
MDRIFQRLLETNFSELSGLTVDASIPVPETLINELIAMELQDNQHLTYCHVSIERQNRLDVDLKTPRWPWPLNFKLKLFGSMDLSPSPRIRAFLENNVLLGKLGSMFKALPPGILIYEDQLSIDIGAFLDSPEQKQLLELLKAVEMRTEEGTLILDVKIEK